MRRTSSSASGTTGAGAQFPSTIVFGSTSIRPLASVRRRVQISDAGKLLISLPRSENLQLIVKVEDPAAAAAVNNSEQEDNNANNGGQNGDKTGTGSPKKLLEIGAVAAVAGPPKPRPLFKKRKRDWRRDIDPKTGFFYNPEAEPNLPNCIPFTDTLEQMFLANRLRIIKKDGYLITPLNCLRELGREWNMNLHFEYQEIHVSRYKVYVVEVFLSSYRGIGECVRRKMAAQLAAADLLENLKADNIELAPYGLVPGCRINPTIFGDLLALCEVMEFDPPTFTRMPTDPEAGEDEPTYSYTCQIGQLIRLGSSDSVILAKRWAARNMYRALTGVAVPMDRVARGYDQCKALLRIAGKHLDDVRQPPAEVFTTSHAEAPNQKAPDEARDGFEDELDITIIKTEGLTLEADEIGNISRRAARMNLGLNVDENENTMD